MRRNFYEAFTLVEMLIVMGILIILMAVGITAGRFAINRANDVAHQNAVDQIYTGLQAYYTDEREFPAQVAPAELFVEGATPADNILFDYLDQGAFKGGTEATFFYFVETDQQQSVLVCVTLGGVDDSKHRGIYCNGNGFGDTNLLSGAITDKNIPYDEIVDTQYDVIMGNLADTTMVSEWNGNSWGSSSVVE